LASSLEYQLKPVFRGDTTLEVLNVNEDFMNMRPTQPSVQGGDSDKLSEEETQATLLQSAQLLDRISAQLDPNPTSPETDGNFRLAQLAPLAGRAKKSPPGRSSLAQQ